MDKKFKQIYYSDDGYWRGKIAIQRLAKASGSTKEEAERSGADPAQNLTGFRGVPKTFSVPRSGEKKFLGPLRGSGGMLPRKILKI